jgi:hypothetical protein
MANTILDMFKILFYFCITLPFLIGLIKEQKSNLYTLYKVVLFVYLSRITCHFKVASLAAQTTVPPEQGLVTATFPHCGTFHI